MSTIKFQKSGANIAILFITSKKKQHFSSIFLNFMPFHVVFFMKNNHFLALFCTFAANFPLHQKRMLRIPTPLLIPHLNNGLKRISRTKQMFHPRNLIKQRIKTYFTHQANENKFYALSFTACIVQEFATHRQSPSAAAIREMSYHPSCS